MLIVLKAVADRVHDRVDQQFALRPRIRAVALDVSIGGQLLNAVQGGDHDFGRFRFAAQFEGKKVLLGVQLGLLLGQRQRIRGQCILFGSIRIV